MTETYVQLPPQSTGKKLATESRSSIGYDNLTGNLFTFQQIITGATSGATGNVTGVNVLSATSGNVIIEDYTGTFQNNESIEVDGTGVALVNITSSPQILDKQKIVITDPNNPERMQSIDRFGATVNTFNGGSPIFSPFGLMQVGTPQSIKEYRFAYSGNDTDFWDQEVSGATVNYDGTSGTMILSNPTTSGSLASRTSNFYHPYNPGTGTLAELSVAVGDVGKANVRRRWGYFDDENGCYFQLDGTTFSVVIRSNVSGSVVNTVVNQLNFNKDKLNGSNTIGFDIDVSKPNVYWIDFQWLGAGRVRFGVLEPNGTRLTCHDFEHANTVITAPYMRTATLPIRVEQENTGISGSSSELKWICGVVKHSSSTPIHSKQAFSVSTDGALVGCDATSDTPVISIRPSQTYLGRVNRGIIRFNSLSYHNDGTAAAVIKIGTSNVGSMTGESFGAVHVGSIAEYDVSATDGTFLVQSAQTLISPGHSETISLQSNKYLHDSELYLGADGTTQDIVMWTARAVGSGNTTNVSVAVNWEEILL